MAATLQVVVGRTKKPFQTQCPEVPQEVSGEVRAERIVAVAVYCLVLKVVRIVQQFLFYRFICGVELVVPVVFCRLKVDVIAVHISFLLRPYICIAQKCNERRHRHSCRYLYYGGPAYGLAGYESGACSKDRHDARLRRHAVLHQQHCG